MTKGIVFANRSTEIGSSEAKLQIYYIFNLSNPGACESSEV